MALRRRDGGRRHATRTGRRTCALTYGLDAARNENDDTFTDLEAKAIAATIRQYGRAVSSSTETIRARCALSGYQGTCRSYEFHVPAAAE